MLLATSQNTQFCSVKNLHWSLISSRHILPNYNQPYPACPRPKFYTHPSPCSKFTHVLQFRKRLRYFKNSNTGEAVLNIIAQASGFTKLIFTVWKTKNPMSSPIPEHGNSRFWLFRYKFVIYEAVLNIIVQATAFARVFFST